MLNQPTIEKLHTMKLHGMADAFRAQLETADASQLSFEERFAMLVDQQWLVEGEPRLARRLHSARLKERGVIEDIDYQHPRGLDRKLLRTLSTSEWVRQNQNVLFIGPTGIGKSWLACALAQKACRDGFSVLHKRATELFPRTGRGARRRQHWAIAAETLPYRCACAGRLRHGSTEGQRTA